MSENVPNHRVKELIDECPMNTTECKKELSEFMGMNIRNIQWYYTGDIKNLKGDVAVKFLEFFNSKRHPDLDPLNFRDIYVSKISLTDDEIASEYGLVESNDNLNK